MCYGCFCHGRLEILLNLAQLVYLKQEFVLYYCSWDHQYTIIFLLLGLLFLIVLCLPTQVFVSTVNCGRAWQDI